MFFFRLQIALREAWVRGRILYSAHNFHSGFETFFAVFSRGAHVLTRASLLPCLPVHFVYLLHCTETRLTHTLTNLAPNQDCIY